MYSQRLQELRNKELISQKEIANILCIEQGTYSDYENEKVTIPIEHLVTLCKYYNVSVDYIFHANGLENYSGNSADINVDKSKVRIKELRKSNGFTQKAFGNLLGVANTTISSYELGVNIISTTIIYNLCQKYNISADYLLGKVDEPKYLN